ncbi:hypothetical protein O181_101372 [Austropuccinia psidii MF-1]|uniref:Reverse transcriptase Ty1/copia-type domain-containing protein n=1 Tax=Austropuccinia psidii MF-1 TaxID=1389203 RepID=A0A9Q3JFV3_9BASI|nr:hypothetical protein [Austropuccinia psidii MF-1]
MNVSSSLHPDILGSYGEALVSNNQKKWKEAISTKIASMERMGMWTEVPKSATTSILGTRWVFTAKRDPAGGVILNKARIVMQAASKFKWPIQTFDVTTAYLRSSVKEDVHV